MPDINDVFNYVMESPDNTNPNVLRSMLNSLESGGGGASALFITVTQTKEGTSTTETWDKTAGEIMDAMPFAYLRMDDNGIVAFLPVQYSGGIGYAWSDEDGFVAQCSEGASHYVTAATRNDYPSVTWSTK